MGRRKLSVKDKIYKRIGRSFAIIDKALSGQRVPQVSLVAAKLIIEIVLKYEKGDISKEKSYEENLRELREMAQQNDKKDI